MLEGLMSRWRRPRWWAAARPAAISRPMRRAEAAQLIRRCGGLQASDELLDRCVSVAAGSHGGVEQRGMRGQLRAIGESLDQALNGARLIGWQFGGAGVSQGDNESVGGVERA